MTILIPKKLFPFNISARLFANTRFENNRFDFSAVIIFGDIACVIRRAHTEMRRAPEKLFENRCCDMTIIDALGFGVKRETGLTVSHVLAFLGSDSSNQVQRLYFLVTVHEPPPFNAMSPRDIISDDVLDVEGDMWIERESIEFIERGFKERGIGYEDGSLAGAKSQELLHVLENAFRLHERSVSQRPSEMQYHPAQTVQPRTVDLPFSYPTVRHRFLHYDLFNRADIAIFDWQKVERCFITEFAEYPESVLAEADNVSPEQQVANLPLSQRMQVEKLLSDINDELKTMEWSCVYVRQTETFRKALRVVLRGRPQLVEAYPSTAMGQVVDIYAARQSPLEIWDSCLNE